ncbi:MAG: glycosyltransferase family 4 protein [Candidatus Gastranaerophilaceae bacterium]|jgi:glycosyltransferase involved in cell wall biosynthesis
MKKLAFVINVFREDDFHSGGEKLFYELVKISLERNYKVDLFCCKYLYSSKEPSLNLNKLIISGNSKFFKHPEKIENLFQEFKKLIDVEEYDHVISENITPPLDIAIIQGHSAQHYLKMSQNIFEKISMKFKKKDFIKYQQKWFKTRYKKIFVPSNTLKKELVSNFDVNEEKIFVAYPGVDIPDNVQNIDIKSIIEQKKPVSIGLSAPSFKNKGGYIFLKSLYLLKSKGLEFNAKIIYPKYKKNLFLQLCVGLYGLKDNVEFLSYQKDMSEFYNSVDIVVVPSILETFGLVVLEAMAYKKIPIVSTYAGASEIIDEGKNGFIFDISQKSYINLAQKLECIIKNPQLIEEMSNNCYQTAKTFSWNSCIESILNKICEETESL